MTINLNIVLTLSALSAGGIVVWAWRHLMTKRKPNVPNEPVTDALAPYDSNDALAPENGYPLA